MRARVVIAAIVAVLVGCGLAAIRPPGARPPEPVVPARLPGTEAPTREATPAAVHHAPVRLPTSGVSVSVEPVDASDHAPGRAFRSDRSAPNSTAGTIVPLPPASPEVWRQRRAVMAEAWEAASLAAASRVADAQGWSAADRDATLGILRAMHAELAAIRVDVESRRVPGAEVRDRTQSARDRARDALVSRLGDARTGSLEAAMREEVHGGGF